jgi:hypothetical protein
MMRASENSYDGVSGFQGVFKETCKGYRLKSNKKEV